VIRLPEFILEHSLYYENDLLNKAMRLQIGASVYYISSYYADAYMPVTGQFFLQSEKKYGNYPFIDFFVAAKIKTVRIFVKVDHLNSGWDKNNYILTPNYPYPGRTFKLGVSWKFYD
jgi:outer membrane receptor protein involved in Fe transport